MMKKGQAAMEFLMTYGWAILVVLAAIAALAYFGVLDPGKLLPERCQFPAGFDCIGKPGIDGTSEEITIEFKNSIGRTFEIAVDSSTYPVTFDGDNCDGTFAAVNITAVNPDDITDTVSTEGTTAIAVQNGWGYSIVFSCGAAGSMDKGKVSGTLDYTIRMQDTGAFQKVVGEIRGRSAT